MTMLLLSKPSSIFYSVLFRSFLFTEIYSNFSFRQHIVFSSSSLTLKTDIVDTNGFCAGARFVSVQPSSNTLIRSPYTAYFPTFPITHASSSTSMSVSLPTSCHLHKLLWVSPFSYEDIMFPCIPSRKKKYVDSGETEMTVRCVFRNGLLFSVHQYL